MGTASTAASDSILAPSSSLDGSDEKKTSDKKEEKVDTEKQIEETKAKLVKQDIPQSQRFTLQQLQDFMAVAPNIAQIRKGIKNMKNKEVIIYKILLDMVGSYIRNFRTVSSRTYQQKYIPAVLEFYNKIDAEDLAEVMKTISESLSTFKCKEMNVEVEIL